MTGTTKETYLTALLRLGKIAREIEADASFIARGEDHGAEVHDFRVLIPLVGGFNAGKTSLVNAWLEREQDKGLPTDIVPQTALATEIHPAALDDAEVIELYAGDDRLVRRVDLRQFQQIEKEALTTGESEAEYARAMVHTPPKYGQDWHHWRVLVDMPGLDSGLRTHNVAIQRYLPRGSYFILVVDVEQGALRASEIDQLREFLDQEVEFAVLVNKVDKKKGAVADVVEHVDRQVRTAFRTSAAVSPVSAHEPKIGALQKIIEDVDFDRALRSFWRRKLLELFDDTIQSLHTRYSALNVSSTDSERTVAELKEDNREMEARLRVDEDQVRERYSDRAVERIVRSVRDAIRDHAPALAGTWQNAGREALEHEVSELVRRTLNRTVGKERSDTLELIIDRYGADLDGIAAHHEQFLSAGQDTAVPEIPTDLGNRVSAAAAASTQAFDQAKKRVATAPTAYTAVAGVLAAATSIVAPWLEVVIITLPTILNWVSQRLEESRRQQHMQERLQEMHAQISSVVAPRIAADVRDDVAKDFESVTKDMIAGLRDHVQNRVRQIQADIARSRAEIDEQNRDVEQRKGQLRAAILRLTEAQALVAEN